MKVRMILACDSHCGIGFNCGLPWPRNSVDVDMFRCLTTGSGHNAVVMGSNTWDSLPQRFRPLPDRLNLVLSRKRVVGPSVYSSEVPISLRNPGMLREFVATGINPNTNEHIEELWVIGGAQIYELALNELKCDTIILTWFKGEYNCDTFFDVKSELYKRNLQFETSNLYEDDVILVEKLEVKYGVIG